MDLKELLATHLPENVERSFVLGISKDEDATQEKVTTTFVYDTSWTVGDLIDRLGIASSPRVTYENKYRPKAVRPAKWYVNKAGTKSIADPVETGLRAILGNELYEAQIKAGKNHTGMIEAIKKQYESPSEEEEE